MDSLNAKCTVWWALIMLSMRHARCEEELMLVLKLPCRKQPHLLLLLCSCFLKQMMSFLEYKFCFLLPPTAEIPFCLKPLINAFHLMSNRSAVVLTTKNWSRQLLSHAMLSDFYIIGPKIAVSCFICYLWDIISASNSPTPLCHGSFSWGEQWKYRWRTIHLHFPDG